MKSGTLNDLSLFDGSVSGTRQIAEEDNFHAFVFPLFQTGLRKHSVSRVMNMQIVLMSLGVKSVLGCYQCIYLQV